MSDDANPAADFAAMMSRAADEAYAEPGEAPYGYMKDPQTGETRPKKTPGRPKKSPSLEELKAEKDAQDPAGPGPAGDRAPDAPRRPRFGRRGGGGKPKEPVPQFREGQIEKAVNKLYRKAGKIVKVVDPQVGTAIIEATRKEDEDDLTVGQAWEEVCRHNPAIRRVVMKFLKGGAYGQLFWAHAPILLAILMKDSVRQRLPLPGLAAAFLDDSEDGETPAEGTPFEGISSEDMQQAMAFAQQMMGPMMAGRGFQMPRDAPGEHEAA